MTVDSAGCGYLVSLAPALPRAPPAAERERDCRTGRGLGGGNIRVAPTAVEARTGTTVPPDYFRGREEEAAGRAAVNPT